MTAASPATTLYNTGSGPSSCTFTAAIDTTSGTGLVGMTSYVEPAGGGLPQRRIVECTSITVPAATNVPVSGSIPLELRATGDVDVQGTLSLSATGQTPGPGGGSGGPAGAAGGGLGGAFGGGSGTISSPGSGGVSGPAYSGGSAGLPGQTPLSIGYGGGGGGAGSGAGYSSGSGGGGGGNGRTGSPGGVGGGGGGASRIVGATQITVAAGGSLSANGGLGFPGTGNSAPWGGTGGGGSGGAIVLIAPSVVIAGAARAVGADEGLVSGLTQNGNVALGGNGANGAITVIANSYTATGTVTPTASVSPHSDQITIAMAGTGSGTVSSTPAGIDCGTDCSEFYDPGASVTLEATPAPGSTFAGWSGACAGQPAECTIGGSGDRTATVTFDVVTTSTDNSGGGTTTGTTTPGAADTTTESTSTPSPAVTDIVAPVVSGVSFLPRRFKARRGTTVRLTLSEAADVRLLVERVISKRRVKRLGTIVRTSVPAGKSSFRITRVGRRALKPGTYRATLTATDAAGNKSKPLRITVVVLSG